MPLSAGTRLGPYTVVSALGAGGMGEVYRSRDTRLDRDVAIKVLPESFAHDADRRARFEREAKAIAALSHPNVLAIFDTGTHEGHLYVVTELLAGETLRERLATGALPVRKAIEVAIQIARGLAAAHDKGLVHRDLKPENVFLTKDGQVKILDFGLARQMPTNSGATETVPVVTDPGTVMGTVGYMAPEQVRGLAIDGRTDLFALGAVLYEMLAGRRAFTGQTAADTMIAIVKEDPPDLGAARTDLPPALDRIVRHSLEKNPHERFQTARDIAFALEALSGPAAPATAVAPPRTARPRRTPLLVTVGLLIGAVVVAFAYQSLFPPAPIDSVAVLPFANATSDSGFDYLSEGLAESLISGLAQVPNLRVASRNSAFRYTGDRAADLTRVARDLKVGSVVTGRLTERGGRLTVRAELTDVSSDSARWGRTYEGSSSDMLAIQEGMTREIARALRVTIDERDAERLAKRVTENGEAYQLYLQGRFFWNQGMQPETNYLRAIEYFTLARNKDPNFALAYAGLADVYGSLPLWHVQPPSVSAPKAMEAVNRALSLDPNLAEAHSALAYIRMPFYEWATVEREFKEAIRLDRNLSPSHAGYSALLASLGRHEEALAEARTAQALDPLDVESRVMVGSVSYLARDFDRAIDELLRALEMDKDHGNTHYWLGLTLLAQRKFPQAVEELIKARSTIGEDDQDELVAQLVAYGAWGKTSDARKLLHDLHAMAGKRWVAPSSFAIAYGGLGDIGKVLDYLEQAYAEHDPFLVFLKTEPIWDPYRAEPRFKRLLDQMGFR